MAFPVPGAGRQLRAPAHVAAMHGVEGGALPHGTHPAPTSSGKNFQRPFLTTPTPPSKGAPVIVAREAGLRSSVPRSFAFVPGDSGTEADWATREPMSAVSDA